MTMYPEAAGVGTGRKCVRSVTEAMVRHAADYADRRRSTGPAVALPAPPATGVAIVACMDARLDVYALFGLTEGDAHVLRNAGGVVTTDVVRSLVISQHALGTREIILVHHTECGMQKITDAGFQQEIEMRTGVRPDWPVHSFADLDGDVRESIRILRASPFLRASTSIRGFVYDVASARLREITA
jgi:carbonic anhydrase